MMTFLRCSAIPRLFATSKKDINNGSVRFLITGLFYGASSQPCSLSHVRSYQRGIIAICSVVCLVRYFLRRPCGTFASDTRDAGLILISRKRVVRQTQDTPRANDLHGVFSRTDSAMFDEIASVKLGHGLA